MDTIGERVKILMEEQGYTEKTLLSALNSSNDPQYPTISKSTLNDILNMDPYAEKHDKGYSYKYFIKLADVFGVSVDYLLCRTDVKPLDNKLQAACDITGLSNDAINVLINSNSKTVLNDFISGKEFLDIINIIETALCFRHLLPADNKRIQKFEDEIKANPNSGAAFYNLAIKNGLAPYYKQQLNELIDSFFNDITNRYLENDVKDGTDNGKHN